ncbi:MAG: hypothetical protein EPN46_04220 [Candidimonas sp.]|nr:MAG: hypothetical protein EPN77_10725 [Candidimonas sp.]TAM21192.1 MAG: hypothetical protein EPN62_14970 [Candidimonas sp.]TAM79065.1 MAG: hypothetical protein EPN46_04220 [Candidimonas sp.]
MSEYQYYEFAAVERSLTAKEMAELRACSTRATITATSFVNEYHWGNLKAEPSDWMRRYFDAFVYMTNWCTCRLAFRVPYAVFSKSELSQYATKLALTIDAAGKHWIIDWWLDESEDYDRFGLDEGRDWMGRLMPLRDELLRGDLRPLYLGWLAGVTAREVDDNAIEPEVPPGLSRLSAAQQALVAFLEIDPDLVAAAAAVSPDVSELDNDDSINEWLAGLSVNEMRAILKLLLNGKSQQAERQFKTAFLTWQKKLAQGTAPCVSRRKVAELRTLAKVAETHRLEREAKARVRQEAVRRKKRDDFLKTLAADFDQCWNALHPLVERGSASGYDQAKHVIIDLADAYQLVSSKEIFDRALRRFLVRHAKRGALIRRLVEAGLWQK